MIFIFPCLLTILAAVPARTVWLLLMDAHGMPEVGAIMQFCIRSTRHTS